MKKRLSFHLRAFVLSMLLAAGLEPIPVMAEMMPLVNNPLPAMLKKVVPGVVNISTTTRIRMDENPLFRDPFFRQFFDIPNMPIEREQQSLGSGVIIDAAKGYVITNNHVIDKADKITVTLQDGHNLDATLIGSDPTTDIALIRIKGIVQTIVVDIGAPCAARAGQNSRASRRRPVRSRFRDGRAGQRGGLPGPIRRVI